MSFLCWHRNLGKDLNSSAEGAGLERERRRWRIQRPRQGKKQGVSEASHASARDDYVFDRGCDFSLPFRCSRLIKDLNSLRRRWRMRFRLLQKRADPVSPFVILFLPFYRHGNDNAHRPDDHGNADDHHARIVRIIVNRLFYRRFGNHRLRLRRDFFLLRTLLRNGL